MAGTGSTRKVDEQQDTHNDTQRNVNVSRSLGYAIGGILEGIKQATNDEEIKGEEANGCKGANNHHKNVPAEMGSPEKFMIIQRQSCQDEREEIRE
eukprot:CAMPEP_0197074554 /NCGR_PEP_ID=MMETSP1384-20130603/211167_1 /TAXON_ID=29189 /ORGANISM="Ammonia sp." /LENGTH=95 /DNA_ID=CAMNT_0042513395 /DNA_START=519 /DNA_END=807 /DNA_ORIENTATION=-